MNVHIGAPMRLSELSNIPGTPAADAACPQTVEEILAIAYVLEREAARHYGDLACCMRLVGRQDLADLFANLAREEQHHVSAVEELAMRKLERMPEIPAVFRWQLPESFGGVDRTVVTDTLTPYEALVTAVHNEERALAFWSAIAAEASDAAVREEAESMARQELLHATTLRLARRRAYRSGGRIRRRPGRDTLERIMEHIDAARIDVARFLTRAATRLDARGDQMTAALLRFACEEIGLRNQTTTLGEGDEDTRNMGDALAVLFKAVGRIDQIGEEVRDCVERYPELAVRGDLARLVRSAALQVAILNRRLSELEPRLVALVAPAGPRNVRV